MPMIFIMPDSHIVVSDATPIIALTLIDRLILLPKLYGKVIIPFAVHAELLACISGKTGIIDTERTDWLHVANLSDHRLALMIKVKPK